MIEITAEDIRNQEMYTAEIIVLAGIMGYSSLPGIRDTEMLGYSQNLKSNIQTIIAALQKKEILKIRPEKNAYIKAEIYHKIKMITECEKIARLITYDNYGQKAVQWIYHMPRERMMLTQDSREQERVLLQSFSVEEQEKRITEYEDLGTWRMTEKEIEDCHQKIVDFNFGNIEENLYKKIDDRQVVLLLMEFFSGAIPLCKATRWGRCQDILKRQKSIGYIRKEDVVLMITSNAQEFIFRRISSDNMAEIIGNCVFGGDVQWKISL